MPTSSINRKRGRQKTGAGVSMVSLRNDNLEREPLRVYLGKAKSAPVTMEYSRPRHRYGTREPAFMSSGNARTPHSKQASNVPLATPIQTMVQSFVPRPRSRSRSRQPSLTSSPRRSPRRARSLSPTHQLLRSCTSSRRTSRSREVQHRHDLGGRPFRYRPGVASRVAGLLGNGFNFFRDFLLDGKAIGRRLGRRFGYQFKKLVYPMMHRCVGYPDAQFVGEGESDDTDDYRRSPSPPSRKRGRPNTEDGTEENSTSDFKRPPKSARCTVCYSLDDEREVNSGDPAHSDSTSMHPGGVLPPHLRFSSGSSDDDYRSGSASPSRIDRYNGVAMSGESQEGSNQTS